MKINDAQLDSIEGLIVLVDFEKAFDSLAWDFILTSLEISAQTQLNG